MRTNKQLLKVLLDNKNLFDRGLCWWICCLRIEDLITIEEENHLKEIVCYNRPKYRLYHEIYNPNKLNSNNSYFWYRGYLKPRLEFLKKHLRG